MHRGTQPRLSAAIHEPKLRRLYEVNGLKNYLFALNNLRWYARLPCKWLIFALVVFLVCFPYPRLTYRHFSRWRDPNALIEPHAAALQPWVDELKASLPPDLPPQNTLRRVEKFVYDKVPYEWDWNTWGLSDYLPTVTETVERAKEDCDGRAVVAASLLSNLGFHPRIVTDFAHVWVQTEHGDTMGPGRKKAVVATEKGLNFNWRALTELPRALAFGISVFPWPRQLIVLVVAWWLLLRRSHGVLGGICALAGLTTGFFLLRAGGPEYAKPIVWMQLLGVLTVLGGVAASLLPRRRAQPTIGDRL